MSDPVTMSDRAGRTLYVGNLPGDISRRDVENLFEKYGHITEIDLKLHRLPGFCFIEFDDPRDAEDAIRGRDGYNFDGNRLRVELSYCGQAWHPSSSNRRPSSSRGRYSSYSSGTGGGRREGISRRSRYSVRVTGLPSSASWQDLKDHMRRAGAVSYSQVFNDRSGKAGVVDYANHEDMESAIRNLDDSEFKNAFSRAFIQVTQITRPGRSYSQSGSRSRSRSRSRSWSRSRSRSRSRILDRISRSRRSRSPNKSGNQRYLSVSKSRSPSKSPFQCRNHRSPSGSKSRSPSKSPLSSRPRSRSHERSISHSSAVKSERIPSAARTDDELDF